MGRSTIIKELANGHATIETALMRLKVILSYLENEHIEMWILKELSGYSHEDIIPKYRKKRGAANGTMIAGSMLSGTKYTNVPIPIGHLPKEIQDSLLDFIFYQSVTALEKSTTEPDIQFCKPIGREITQVIENGLNAHIAVMNIIVDNTAVVDIVSTIKLKILDICIELEKNFGNLDEFDILSEIKADPGNMSQITNYILNVIYDNSIEIGDNNKIVKSKIGDLHE